MKRGVTSERIILVPGSFVDVGGKQIIHTLSEMRAVVQYARINDTRKIILVAPKFHLLRTFMSGVFALNESCPDLVVYPAFGTSLNWDEESSHSQGVLTGTRVDFLVEEMIRIYTYHAQGNLPDPEDVLSYLDRRDRA